MLSSESFHPFALIVDPAAVFRAVEASSTLGLLQARVFRPLEQVDGRSGTDADVAAYDAQVDAVATDSATEEETDPPSGTFPEPDFI